MDYLMEFGIETGCVGRMAGEEDFCELQEMVAGRAVRLQQRVCYEAMSQTVGLDLEEMRERWRKGAVNLPVPLAGMA